MKKYWPKSNTLYLFKNSIQKTNDKVSIKELRKETITYRRTPIRMRAAFSP